MFFGDMTLEGARVEADGSRKQVDGWGMEHQCRAWVSGWLIFVAWEDGDANVILLILG